MRSIWYACIMGSTFLGFWGTHSLVKERDFAELAIGSDWRIFWYVCRISFSAAISGTSFCKCWCMKVNFSRFNLSERSENNWFTHGLCISTYRRGAFCWSAYLSNFVNHALLRSSMVSMLESIDMLDTLSVLMCLIRFYFCYLKIKKRKMTGF